MSRLRAFLYAPSARLHRAELRATQRLLPGLSTPELMEAAYRRSGSRQNAFFFAQGVVVGALGNLFATSLGHFIDHPAGAPPWTDVVWGAVGALSLLVIVSMAIGALRRYGQNTQAERMCLEELVRRGAVVLDDRDDPDEFLAAEKA